MRQVDGPFRAQKRRKNRREGGIMRLDEKVAVVTGAGAGIGRAIALRFAQEGARTVVADCNRSSYASGEGTVNVITASGGEALFVHTDVSLAADAENMVRATMNAFGRLDILVNNAGIELYRTITEMTEEEWDSLIDINLKGVFLCSKYAVPVMAEGGAIINMSSVAAFRGSPRQSAYCASKGGVMLMTQAMAAELRPRGIRVNALNPSIIDDDMGRVLIEDIDAAAGIGLPDLMARIEQRQWRLGTPEDVANAALFLASDEASFITGHGLAVDGGLAAT